MSGKRTKLTADQEQVAFRLPSALIKRLDQHVKRMAGTVPGVKFSRADAVRSLLTIALDQAEGK